MVRVDRMSFFRHLPNCICPKCGMKRETWMTIGKKITNGRWVPDDVNIEEFNSQIKERKEIDSKQFHYKGRFTA